MGSSRRRTNLNTLNTDFLPLGFPGTPSPTPTPTPSPAPGPGPVPPFPVPPSLVWDAAFTSDTIPTTMCACSNTTVSITVNNTGTTGWLQNDVRLGAYNDPAKQFSPVLVPLEPDTFVSPGHSYTFTFILQAPCTPGTYDVEYRLVKNNGEWFGNVLKATVSVNPCGVVTNVRPGEVKQVSPAVSAADLIARKGAVLTRSSGDISASGPAGFSSLQSQALERYAAKSGTYGTSRGLSGTFLQGILTTFAGTLVPW